ncbi:hypothetical protein ACLUTX_00335 [Enterobacterales bacterium AE_CKDN230030158-1A_HGKHYDSX7]
MHHSTGLRYMSWLFPALLLGCLAGWHIGGILGLNGNTWFAEPEFTFEVVAALCGASCGALICYANGQGLAWQAAAAFAGTCFVLSILGYTRHSLGVPVPDIGFAPYLRQFLIQTFGLWLAPVFGAALVSLLRVVLR